MLYSLKCIVFKSLVLSLLLVVFLGLPLTKVSAQEKNFHTSLVNTYTISQTGSTSVTQTFKIKNLTPSMYLKQYKVQLSIPDISGITVTAQGESIVPTVIEENGTSSIGITFPKEVVGEGKEIEFTISYQTASLATVVGSVLEMHIPAVEKTVAVDETKILVVSPETFGKPTRAEPSAVSSEMQNGTVTTLFEGTTSSISVFYGSSQVFDVAVKYSLKNEGTAAGLVQVALPPDTAFQKMVYQDLDPRPQAITRDTDGNWIATYRVEANATVTPYLRAKVELRLEPFSDYTVPTVSKEHREAQPYWEANDQSIIDTAKNKTANELFNYVVETLQYDMSDNKTEQRTGVLATLKQPSFSSSSDFSDVFIALARSAQIPARRLTGYAYSTNQQLRPTTVEGAVLHSWADYYDHDKSTWIPVDPTWSDTTGGQDYFRNFDLQHIVFAINGVSSTLPYPGGSYKETDATPIIEVQLSESEPAPAAKIEIDIQPKKVLSLPIPGLYFITLENLTGRAWYNINPTFELSNTHIDSLSTQKNQILLPFETKTLDIMVYNDEWKIENTDVVLQLDSKQQELDVKQEYTFTSIPGALRWLFSPWFFAALAALVVFVALVTRRLLVPRRK